MERGRFLYLAAAALARMQTSDPATWVYKAACRDPDPNHAFEGEGPQRARRVEFVRVAQSPTAYGNNRIALGLPARIEVCHPEAHALGREAYLAASRRCCLAASAEPHTGAI